MVPPLQSSFETEMQTLKLDDPWLPPRPWDPPPPHLPLPSPLHPTSTLTESSLVRLAINALQGVQSSVITIEKLYPSLSSTPTDRTVHRNPTLWERSFSTLSLANILKEIAEYGRIVFLLLEFVSYFTTSSISLVNQAFGIALGKVLEGYVSGLDTLYASARWRRGSGSSGCCEVTLLEFYLHTKGLTTQIEALGNICQIPCFSLSNSENVPVMDLFDEFPRGADLLSYLYTHLKVSDPVHRGLLKFLFLRSCEPYCDFVRSWIYKAKVSDPYNEFIVDYVDNQLPYSVDNIGISTNFPSASIRERDGVAVPCFLKDLLIPLFRAGQQLQVLMKLLELLDNVGTWKCTYEDFLPYWSSSSTDSLSCASPLIFSKGGIEIMISARNSYYNRMMEKLENILTKLDFRHQQVFPYGMSSVFFNNGGRSHNNRAQFAKDDRLDSQKPSTKDQILPEGTVDSEASSITNEFSYMEDSLDSDECTSLNSSEEQNQSEQQIEFSCDTVGLEQKYLSALVFSSSTSVDNSMQKPLKSDSCEILEKTDQQDYFVYLHHCLTNLNDNPLSDKVGDLNLSLISTTQHSDNQEDMGWLPRGLWKDLSDADVGKLDDTEREMYQNPSGTCASEDLFCSNSWKFKYHSNFLSRNPMSGKTSFVSKPGERQSIFDFTSVKDPFIVSMDRLAANPRHQIGTELPFSTDSDASPAFGVNGIHDEVNYNCKKISVDKIELSPLQSMDNRKEHNISTNASGGSSWQSLLDKTCNGANITAEEHKLSLATRFEIPLDYVIEKCLLEEIQLQYKYVSKLTIKFLEEGFNLQEHLLALRRYHFMELADWADLFIMSLGHHKWYITDADSRISEIQGFLELSIQRSSCERDVNKDRLYVYMKENSTNPLSASATGIHSFDFLGLGYRVEWPVSIVLTPAALKIYAEIFSFLIQVKLALSSVAETWCSLKAHHSELHKSEVGHLRILMKLRQRVNHFVATLQQYVQSQLSHVSWCNFLYSLKHKVKDMMDIESVHMAYLNDSLHICFLSEETRLIASIVRSILQCALDLRSCVIESSWETELDRGSSSRLSRINISQVLTIKGTFDKNIKELYVCYLKVLRHGKFGLAGFWDYLNYNEYYSEIIGKEMGHRVFSI